MGLGAVEEDVLETGDRDDAPGWETRRMTCWRHEIRRMTCQSQATRWTTHQA